MQHCILYYFTGTNNTKHITRMIENNFKERNFIVKTVLISSNMSKTDLIDIKNYDFIGIGYPIYGLSCPKTIIEFIKTLPKSDKQITFIYETAGDYSVLNIASSNKVKRALINKNYKVTYERTVIMGSNWLVNYGDAITRVLYSTALDKTRQMVSEMVDGKIRKQNPNFLIRTLCNVVAFLERNFGSKLFGLSLHTNKNCNNCMKCIKNCPNLNIKQYGNKIKFGVNCLWCMKCIYNCPQNAIKSFMLQCCILKNGYDLEKILKSKSEKIEIVDQKHFKEYINTLSK